MLQRYGGKAGEYLWEKEMERLERYKDRRCELQSREAAAHPILVLIIFNVAIVVGILAFSLI